MEVEWRRTARGVDGPEAAVGDCARELVREAIGEWRNVYTGVPGRGEAMLLSAVLVLWSDDSSCGRGDVSSALSCCESGERTGGEAALAGPSLSAR